MNALGRDTVIGVVGAGAMGAGIAQVAAMQGHRVVLADAFTVALGRAKDVHEKAMRREVEKQRLSLLEAEDVLQRITYLDGVTAESLRAMSPSGLVIEAIIEDLGAKRDLFRGLEAVLAPDAVLATNTSSLSVAALAGSCARPERVIG
ncbi:MAG: 3-hydroxyacyl-CoA dehydrogenase family protein, partial [Gemmatimonadaceae bacterium]